MKLPLSWLKEFVAVDATAQQLADRLSVAGLVVENIDRLAASFHGVVIAKVIEAGRHPNADRLSLCQVDTGAAGRFSVVCGAPNVRAGMTAALATVGAQLGAEPPLRAAKIRGVESNGMLCSERELGLSAEHAGILELPSDAPLGIDLASYLAMDDTVLDVEITPNRGDCLSILGLAREVAALFGVPLKIARVRTPKIPGAGTISLEIDIQAPELCLRYAALAMRKVKIGPSPIWMRRRLELCGMRPLSNLVDVTNYVMLERGQPLHAFDFAKIAGGKIIVRRAGADREFVTLDNVTRELAPDDLLIADAEKPLAIAGVMGGLNSEVSESTDAIVLESAFFAPIAIAKTSRRLGLVSEASYRFARSIDRAGQAAAALGAGELVRQLAGGKIAAPLIDLEPRTATPREIALDLPAMTALLGVEIPAATAKRRLISIGCKVKSQGRARFAVTAPSWRPDLNEAADLAEEVARLGGLEDIPEALPPRIATLAAANPEREFIAGTREVMLGAGLTEALTIAFIAPADNQRFGGIAAGASAVKVENPLSAELGELRLSILPGLLGALRFNLNRQASTFHGFEIAKTFARHGDYTLERQVIGGVSYGAYAAATIGEPGLAAGFFAMKGIIETYFGAMELAARAEFRAIDPARTPFLHPGRSAEILLEGESAGYVGELHPAEALRLDLAAPCAVFELDLEKLISYGFSPRKTFPPPPRFPAIRRDLALVLERGFPAAMVARTVRDSTTSPLLESVEVFDVYAGQGIAPGRKSIALACLYRATDRTLTDEEVNRVHTALVEQARTRLGAELRQ
ncbi:MAG TPA: phenylalanine--tRNA ligase subunit beta [Candidatus Binataceae bacterium]|nr:phenylalanine--tRNA ligase subunit beta [Candidatus Binataceae bacterium]